jgi:hypothetical protein
MDALYQHKYVIFDDRRIFADYIAFVEYDPEGDEKLRIISISRHNDEEYFETNEKLINDAYDKAKATIRNEVSNCNVC